MSHIFVISGPSRSGKSSIAKHLLAMPLLQLSKIISTTSRAPREGEKNGVDYFFVSKEEFHEMILDEKFAEWLEVHHHLYGIAKSELNNKMQSAKNILLVIDVKGARAVKQLYPAITIFITPSSIQDIQQRMRNAGFPKEEIATRLATAREELECKDEFDYTVINETGNLNATVVKVAQIIKNATSK